MPTRPETRAALAAMIDHTLLRPEATPADVLQLCLEAEELGVAAVCVSPSRLPLPALRSGIGIASVVGFPSGAHAADVKAGEAALAVDNGATEIDMVIDLGLGAARDWAAVEQDVRLVRDAIDPEVVLKVIVESAILDDEQLVAACQAAERAGANFVKTSTGFHPAGGATVHAVALMADTVGGRLGVKASGGIRSTDDALAMIAAGATRIGASRTADILAGLPEP